MKRSLSGGGGPPKKMARASFEADEEKEEVGFAFENKLLKFVNCRPPHSR